MNLLTDLPIKTTNLAYIKYIELQDSIDYRLAGLEHKIDEYNKKIDDTNKKIDDLKAALIKSPVSTMLRRLSDFSAAIVGGIIVWLSAQPQIFNPFVIVGPDSVAPEKTLIATFLLLSCAVYAYVLFGHLENRYKVLTRKNFYISIAVPLIAFFISAMFVQIINDITPLISFATAYAIGGILTYLITILYVNRFLK